MAKNKCSACGGTGMATRSQICRECGGTGKEGGLPSNGLLCPECGANVAIDQPHLPFCSRKSQTVKEDA